MNKKLSLLITAGAIALLQACGESAIDSSEASIANATLNVLVKDAITGNAIEAASVKLLSTGESGSTSEAGMLAMHGVSVGTHTLQVEKAGYAGIVASTNISAGNVVANDRSATVNLYPLVSSLEGYAFYEDKDGIKNPARDANVRLQSNCNECLVKEYNAKAGADGKFVFDSLPLINGSLYFMAGRFGGQEYQTKNVGSIYDLSIGKNTFSSTNNYYAFGEGATFAYLGTKSIIHKDSSIVLTFSDNLDKEKTKLNNINVSGNAIVDKTIDGNKLVIKPLGEWEQGATISIYGTFYSVNNQSLIVDYYSRINISVQAEALDAKIEGFAQDGDVLVGATSVDLKWTQTKGASYYKLYAKNGEKTATISSNIDKEYYCTTTDGKSTCATTAYLNSVYSQLGYESASEVLAAGKTLDFVLQAVGVDGSVTPLTGANAASIKVTPKAVP